jgi:hypothetical protein
MCRKQENKYRRQTHSKFCKLKAVPMPMYGSENAALTRVVPEGGLKLQK